MFDDAVLAEGDGMAETSESTTTDSSSSNREGEYSSTNNQESGVDEADFIKTDGHYIYMLNGNKFLIMGVPEFGEINLTSSLSMLGSPMQMMVVGDRVVIVSGVNYWNLESNHPFLEFMDHE